jgi:anti-sigma factor RsiW
VRCVDAIERIARRLEGDLPPDLVRELEEHLASCSRCRAEQAVQAALLDALATPPPVELSDDFTANVVEAAIGTVPKRSRPLGWPALAPPFAVAAAVASILLIGPGVARIVDPGKTAEWVGGLASVIGPFRSSLGGTGRLLAECARSASPRVIFSPRS